jgi:hypothetical protein
MPDPMLYRGGSAPFAPVPTPPCLGCFHPRHLGRCAECHAFCLATRVAGSTPFLLALAATAVSVSAWRWGGDLARLFVLRTASLPGMLWVLSLRLGYLRLRGRSGTVDLLGGRVLAVREDRPPDAEEERDR